MNKTVCAWLLPVTALLSGCGGGGSGTASLSGIEGSGTAPNRITSAGPVTAKGSIFVNGIEYQLTGAVISIDGNPASEADLDVGNIVTVEGDLNTLATGTARRVTSGIAVAGPISAVDRAGERITILGQVVVVDTATRIVGDAGTEPLGGLQVGDQVEVAGFADSSGLIFARRIAPRSASTPLRLTGYVGDLDAGQHRFAINRQPVDYTRATLSGFAGRTLIGAPVRVDGDDVDAQGALRATEVAYRDPGLPGNTGDTAALQGWVTRFASDADFDVDGRRVVTTANTKVTGPVNSVVSIVRLDAFIEVRGKLIANGVVEATEIVTNNLVSMDAVIWGTNVPEIGGEFPHDQSVIPNAPGVFDRHDQSIVANLWGGGASSVCTTNEQTSVSIDGASSIVEALQVGDVATIYQHHPDDFISPLQDGNCQIVAVEHNVRGPVESKPTDSLSFYVMGQRVWLDPAHDTYGGRSGFDSLESLNVGDIVEVSGHTTAEGDILATGIHAGAAKGQYRVIGLARDVDHSAAQFKLGNLTVDYHDAALAGFDANGPTERDRVLVLADAPPSGGAWHADIVRFTGDLPRGTFMNFVRYNGLVTRYAGPDDLDIEGRRVVPVQPQWGDVTEGNRCDRTKVAANLSSIYMLGLGWGPGQFAHFGFAVCPAGRTLDPHGANGFPDMYESASINVSAVVQSIDADRRVIRVAGLDMALQPGTRITRFEASSDPASGTLTPLQFADVHVGDRVGVISQALAGHRAVTEVWLDDGVRSGDIFIKAPAPSVVPPEVVLLSGIRVQVTPATALDHVLCGEPAKTESSEVFWSAIGESWYDPLLIQAHLEGSRIVAERIEWRDCPGVVEPVEVSSRIVISGTRVVLRADWADSWSQEAGPKVDLVPGGDGAGDVEFVTPIVTSPVDLVFIRHYYGDGGDEVIDMPQIHVVPANPDGSVDPVYAGPDQTVSAGQVFYLSASIDYERCAVCSFGWSQIGGPTVGLNTINSTRAAIVAPRVEQPVDLVFRFSYTPEERADTYEDTVTIHVLPVK